MVCRYGVAVRSHVNHAAAALLVLRWLLAVVCVIDPNRFQSCLSLCCWRPGLACWLLLHAAIIPSHGRARHQHCYCTSALPHHSATR